MSDHLPFTTGDPAVDQQIAALLAARRDDEAYQQREMAALRECFERAEARVVALEAENALLKRALAMLTRSLEDAEAESHGEP